MVVSRKSHETQNDGCAEVLDSFQGIAGYQTQQCFDKRIFTFVMDNPVAQRPIILLVDDNPHDVVLTRLAFRKIGIIDTIKLVKDGLEAMEYLSGTGLYADRQTYPMPTLLLLDLKMPQSSGFDVLTWIRTQPPLQGLVVVVMSSSKEKRDVQRAYELGAHAYLVKPSRLSELVGMMQAIKEACLIRSSEQLANSGAKLAQTCSSLASAPGIETNSGLLNPVSART